MAYNYAAAITVSDTVPIVTGPTAAVYIGTKGATGTLVGILPNGATATFVGLAAGTILPVTLTRVNASTTDVSTLVALYQV